MTEQKHDDARGASHSDAELERFKAWWSCWTNDTPSWREGWKREVCWIVWKAAIEAEREACAGICDRFAERDMHPAECAGAIRMRSNAS